jgi:hypothetical protein
LRQTPTRKPNAGANSRSTVVRCIKKQSNMNIDELTQLLAGSSHLAVTTQLAQLHEYPDVGSQVLEHVVENSSLLVFDAAPINGYLKVKNVSTLREGWIYSNLVKLVQAIPKTSESPFTPEGSTPNIEYRTTPLKSENSWLAQATEEVFLHEKPDENSTVLELLSCHSQLFVYNTETVNGYFQVIDINTNLEGWVQSDFVKFDKALPKNDKSPFEHTGWSVGEECIVEITNNTHLNLTLKMNSTRYHISPGITNKISFEHGFYKYVASAKSVRPYFGEDTLLSGRIYSWTFYITTALKSDMNSASGAIPIPEERYQSKKKKKGKR